MGATRVPGSQPIAWLKIDDLDYDPEIQRPTDEKRADRIAADFDPDKFGVIAVWKRDDDHYVVVDGMHRVTALRAMGWNGQKIPCSVFEGISKAEAARLFLGRNDARSVRYIDKFLVRLVEGDPTACAVNSIVQAAGYIIDREHRDGVITAAKALEDIYVGRGQRIKGENPVALRRTLAVLTEAWGRTTDAVNGRVLLGVGAFFLRYDDAVDDARMAKKIAVVPGKDALIARGAGVRERHGGTIPAGIAHYLVDEYNRGLKKRSARLPGWRESGEASA